MNYTDCGYDFTPGQAERGYAVTQSYHPGLLENDFTVPNLDVTSLGIQQDTDGDGILNPGETANIRINIINSWGANADSILLTLSSEDDRLEILDSTVQFEDPLAAGETSFGPFLDMFQIRAEDGITMGTIDCNLNILTANEDYPYEIDVPVEINISLHQLGFPVDAIAIKSSPILIDIDDNLTGDIFFGSDNGKLYGFMVAGMELPGFPFNTDGDIRSSPAVADIDNDGGKEIIFGSNDGTLYVLNSIGVQELAYGQSGSINGSPAIMDLDQDGDREIIFTIYNGVNSSGEVCAIHHNGTEVAGFPVNLDEKMMDCTYLSRGINTIIYGEYNLAVTILIQIHYCRRAIDTSRLTICQLLNTNGI
jgi:hypothetical protein